MVQRKSGRLARPPAVDGPVQPGLEPESRSSGEESSRRELEKNLLRLQLAVNSAGLAWWDHNLVTDEVSRSDTWSTMLGYTPAEIAARADAWRELVHPADMPQVLEAARRHEAGELPEFEVEHRMRAKDGSWRWILNWGKVVARGDDGRSLRAMGFHLDITRRKQAELDRESLIEKLEKALAEIRTLQGIIPICAACKKIRDDRGYWNQLETYLSHHSHAEFSHGLCPECLRRLYPDLQD